ncbi:hypothetical protein COOONC_19554 [Cooperia oncophora]
MQRLVVAAVLLLAATQTLSAPTSKDKPIVLFTCPPDGLCYASPRNCFDNCNAAFSMSSPENGTKFKHITNDVTAQLYSAHIAPDYLSDLHESKFQFSDKYDKAIICSFHSPRGIVARVNYPDPIVIQPFIDATEPEGHTDTTYTQCSTNVSQSAPTKAKFKLISGKWESELDLGRELGHRCRASCGERSSNKIEIPSSKLAAVRAEDDSAELDEKISEATVREESQGGLRGYGRKKKKKVKVVEADDEKDNKDNSEEDTKKGRKLSVDDSDEDSTPSKKDGKGKVSKIKDSKRGRKEKIEDDEDEDEKKVVKKPKMDDDDDGKEMPEDRDYGDEHDEQYVHFSLYS